ncbi:NAD(P)-dependent dehydrogenase (short-subunit alcohol dehydrogenase family) [Amycolatopsis bartoniae]|uniref:3-oxoacyl-ACP reductase n=1 Tax=Amycolatopsis bartoniae TaxID=941986 RepID=A0A8H9IQ66_9PSEU|nr:SDR family NAD(P)-dependent oxidoreductase [Amycolatopsis bartoniae]MBB2934514.1 NAD(P)-dependent dehydrogenase (short-subunit alcohol dehydrogenase family) [Amycolatopsis bartoniae]TVT01892.1 SDR family NAD(P)-dependent oxidoreductase [Amycolatopsis bartoniae]GHF46822.1 3-oxoacyl-ACP reductase [Amycolatopsis bartoniae]
MDLNLAGKRVLVTGASRGIGLAIVEGFRAEGAEVVAVSRKSTPELEATGATFVSADLAAPGEPRRAVEAALAADPRLDVLVNNAGGGEVTDADLLDPLGGSSATWENVLALNLGAAVEMTRAAMPALSQAGGAVVNIGSSSARDPRGVPLPYAAAKAGLNAFSRGLAEKVAETGVRVNVVTPGSTRTAIMTSPDGYVGRVAASMGVEHDTLLAALPQQSGMVTGTLIEPAEIARAVLLLASPTMPSAVGSNWTVDGGTLKTP